MKYLKSINEFTLYHGTNANFDCFDIKRVTNSTSAASYGYGIYFTSKYDLAEFYAALSQYNGNDYERVTNLIKKKMKSEGYHDSVINRINTGVVKNACEREEYFQSLCGDDETLKKIFTFYKKKYITKAKYLYSINLHKPLDEMNIINWGKPCDDKMIKNLESVLPDMWIYNYKVKVSKDTSGTWDQKFVAGDIINKDTAEYNEVPFSEIVSKDIKFDTFEKAYDALIEFSNDNYKTYDSGKKATEILQSFGYDGIEYHFEEDNVKKDIYCIFNPENIKIVNVCKLDEYNSVERLEDSDYDYDEEVLQRTYADRIENIKQSIKSYKRVIFDLNDRIQDYDRGSYKDRQYHVLKSRKTKLEKELKDLYNELKKWEN